MARLLLAFLLTGCAAAQEAGPRPYRAGATVVDATPEKFPVIVNGMFTSRTAASARDPVLVRALVLDDGRTRVAIAVVDSCMMPRDLIDRAKDEASKATGIPPERMLVSATHTHSAPSAMGCLGTDADAEYPKFLPGKIARAIVEAAGRLEPAEVGWGSAPAPEHTHCRRWILRPDKVRTDPFGERTVRAMMHPGYQNPDFVAPAGPVDAELSMLAVRARGGRPIALLANYSMHYFGSPIVSADYFGVFARKFAEAIGSPEGFVAMMSQGTSGDQMWMDYGSPRKSPPIDEYAGGLVNLAHEAWKRIEYRGEGSIAMAEARLHLGRRVADGKRLAWARDVLAKLQGPPKSQPEIYAREQVLIAQDPTAELKLQAVRVGDRGMTAIPNEVYGITGLKLKAQSPLPIMNVELANGAEGYIPPPEHHALGGYCTWAARTAGLEVQAEPKIVEALLKLLEEVSGRPRRKFEEPPSGYRTQVLRLKPAGYWALGEWSGESAADLTGNGNDARYEGGVAPYMEGWAGRAPHLAGGRVRLKAPASGSTSVALWFWAGIAAKGSLVSDLGLEGGKLHLGALPGKTPIPLKEWQHVVLVRDGKSARVYLNGRPELEAEGTGSEFILGAGFEGKVDEAAYWTRTLTPDEVARIAAAR